MRKLQTVEQGSRAGSRSCQAEQQTRRGGEGAPRQHPGYDTLRHVASRSWRTSSGPGVRPVLVLCPVFCSSDHRQTGFCCLGQLRQADAGSLCCPSKGNPGRCHDSVFPGGHRCHKPAAANWVLSPRGCKSTLGQGKGLATGHSAEPSAALCFGRGHRPPTSGTRPGNLRVWCQPPTPWGPRALLWHARQIPARGLRAETSGWQGRDSPAQGHLGEASPRAREVLSVCGSNGGGGGGCGRAKRG